MRIVFGLQFLQLYFVSWVDLSKLLLKLSSFHHQILLFGNCIHTHNFAPHNIYICNNKYILYRNKSLYYKEWLSRDIWSVRDLIKHGDNSDDDKGNILDYNAFTFKRGFTCHPKEFYSY